MRPKTGCKRLSPDVGREDLLRELTQPLTTAQLAKRLSIDRERCSHLIRTLAEQGHISCLNALAARSRLYWHEGSAMSHPPVKNQESPTSAAALPHDLIEHVDWELYGWLCFSHRSAVLRALDEPRNAASLRRAARFADPSLRMSSNNARDVLTAMSERGVVAREPQPNRRTVYHLSDSGRLFRRLLLGAESSYHNDTSRQSTKPEPGHRNEE